MVAEFEKKGEAGVSDFIQEAVSMKRGKGNRDYFDYVVKMSGLFHYDFDMPLKTHPSMPVVGLTTAKFVLFLSDKSVR